MSVPKANPTEVSAESHIAAIKNEQGIYDVSVFLHHGFSFARALGPYHNKVAIASRSYPRAGIWTAAQLKKEPQFIEFFQKPFNREGYTLKTKL